MASLSLPPQAISIHDAVALSGRFPLLAGVDLEVGAGESVLIEGPNGAGKTSLLRVCAALVPLASGSVTLLGLDPVRRRTEIRRRVGLLAHGSHLYDDLTVRENVRFAVRAAAADPQRMDGALEMWDLTGRLLRTTASRLSAGQRRRVALCILTARWPELWLLDEPHAGLDAAARELLNQVVNEALDSGVTVVVASHETEPAEALAGRAVTLRGGRVVSSRRIGPRYARAVNRSPGERVPEEDGEEGKVHVA
ncbi:MAG: heme ABC exporter ATP-binding protein CcmA [Acidimicrobiales bacterium]